MMEIVICFCVIILLLMAACSVVPFIRIHWLLLSVSRQIEVAYSSEPTNQNKGLQYEPQILINQFFFFSLNPAQGDYHIFARSFISKTAVLFFTLLMLTQSD